MNDGNPDHNRIEDALNIPIREVNKDAVFSVLENCNASIGCKGFINLMAKSFFEKQVPHTLNAFRQHIYSEISVLVRLRANEFNRMAAALLSSGVNITRKGLDIITMDLIERRLGRDIDFDTVLYIFNILERNNWADFESLFSQIDPVPRNSETQTSDIIPQIENFLRHLGAAAEQPTNSHRPPEWDMKVSYASLEVILKRLSISPEISLFILATLKEATTITSGSEILIDTLHALVSQKLTLISEYIKEVCREVSLAGVTIDREIMRIILGDAFNKYLPSEIKIDPRYGKLVKLINNKDEIEFAFTRIGRQYKLMDYLEETQPMAPIKLEQSETETKDIREP